MELKGLGRRMLFTVLVSHLLLSVFCLSTSRPWITFDDSIQLEFEDKQVKSLFTGNTAFPPRTANNVAHNLFLQKSPVCEVVVQKFHFTSNSALLINLNDQFCAGQSYSVWDNGLFLARDFPSLPTICGVSTAFQNQQLIYSPQFMQAEYPIPAGEHRLIIVVKGSKIGSNVSSMQILLIPTGPIVGTQALVKISKMTKEKIYVPADFDITSIQ